MRLAVLAVALVVAAPAARAQDGACTDGTATLGGVSYPCDRVDILANVGPLGADGPFRSNALNDIWGWTDPDTGGEYALVGTRSGVVFVDVSVPEAPRVLGRMPSTDIDAGNVSAWRDIKVYQDHAFVVADAMPQPHGMQVFDLTRLRGLAADPQRDFGPDAVYEPVFDAHNLVINEATGFAYAVGGDPTPGLGLPPECSVKGFHAINVQDPQHPTFAGCFSDVANETGPRTPGYTHDAQCVLYSGPDADYAGREICFGANEDVVSTLDVTDKGAVRLVSQALYPSASYTHQGWLSEDQRYFYTNDELDERNGLVPTQRTIVLDVSDLDAPDVAFIYDSGITSIDHNLYTHRGLMWQANYEAGLRILDPAGTEAGTLSEVAFFDAYPARTTINDVCPPPNPNGALCASFNGLWSVYPFFESGVVVASGIDNGLFVLRPDADLRADTAAPPPAGPAILSAPVPNPTRDGARLTLTVDAAQPVTAALYDTLGRRVATLFDGPAAPDAPIVLTVDGSGLPSGVYVVRARGASFDLSQSLTLAR